MSLLVVTPMYGGQCFAAHFKSCLALKDAFHDVDLDHDWLVTWNESLITRGRNTSAAAFLETDFQKMLFIDGDIEFEPESVACLWNMNVDVAVGAYRMKHEGSPLGAWIDGKLVDIEGMTEPVEVDYAGTGFMMIDRSVFERLKPHVPEYEEGRGVGKGRQPCWGFFLDPVEDGVHLSEDYHFCKRFREIGGKVMLDPTIRLKHWGLKAY